MENKIISLDARRGAAKSTTKAGEDKAGTVVPFGAMAKSHEIPVDPIAACMEFRDPTTEAVGLKWYNKYLSSPAVFGSWSGYQKFTDEKEALRWLDGSTQYFKKMVNLHNHKKYELKKKENPQHHMRYGRVQEYDWSEIGIDWSDYGGALAYLAPWSIVSLFNQREALKAQLPQCAQALETMIMHPLAPVCLPQLYEISWERVAKANLDPTEICTSEVVLECLSHLPTDAILKKIGVNLGYVLSSHTNYSSPMCFVDGVYERKYLDANGIEGLDHPQRGDRREVLKAGLRYGTVALLRICEARLGTRKTPDETMDRYLARLQKTHSVQAVLEERKRRRQNLLERTCEKQRTRARHAIAERKEKARVRANFMEANYAALVASESVTGFSVLLRPEGPLVNRL